jgi:molecular chaperone IbpA
MEDVAMSTMFDVEPLRRFSIGFDHLFDVLDQAIKNESPINYPPYDIAQTGEDVYRLSLALAGWTPTEVTVTTEPNRLIISGKKAEPEGRQFLYQGIPATAFEHRFNLADYVQVYDARMADGLLVIDLVREVPEAMKPRRIEIANSNEPRALEQKQAA